MVKGEEVGRVKDGEEIWRGAWRWWRCLFEQGLEVKEAEEEEEEEEEAKDEGHEGEGAWKGAWKGEGGRLAKEECKE